jgi:hypothetical protein
MLFAKIFLAIDFVKINFSVKNVSKKHMPN